ncbi:MAG: acetyl-CoA acetyltransferase [Deltaproteobacteria bacterium]|jgi:acetyl-CoA acetyltransferase|nr:acetyl-CoA acetyltransferase [Deltaproteobacteria bacterium]
MREVCIIGVGIHRFGRFPDKTFIDLGAKATLEALKDAKIGWEKIQAAYCGSVYSGSGAGSNMLAEVGLSGIPIMGVEAACAAGGVALKMGYQAIAHGEYDIVLTVGFEKMPKGFIVSPRFQEWERQMGLGVNPIWMALAAQRHMAEYGTTVDQLVKVSVKSHQNGALNPNAMYQKALSYEEILNSPMVCDPLHLLMLCAPNEGAAAAILCSKDKAGQYTNNPVTIAACELRSALHVSDRNLGVHYAGTVRRPTVIERVSQAAYEAASTGPQDLSLVELQDTDVGSEIIYSEELGLCKEGEGGRLIDEGATEINGRIPINVSGGLLSKGEPVGASALGQIHEIVLQLRGQAGPRQVSKAKTGLSHVYGGGGYSCVTILKR